MIRILVPRCLNANTDTIYNVPLSMTSNSMPVGFISYNCTAVMLLFLPVFYYPFHLCHSVFSSLRVWWPRHTVIASGFNICLVFLFMDRTQWVREGGYWMCWDGKHLSHLPPIYQHRVPVTNAAHWTHTLKDFPKFPFWMWMNLCLCICVAVRMHTCMWACVWAEGTFF